MAAEAEEDNGELAALTARLHGKRAARQQLQEQVAIAEAERDAAQRSCAAGIHAARVNMARMQAELSATRSGASGGSPAAAAPELALASSAEAPTAQALQLEARTLRHELSKWQHQAELLEAARPEQDEEIAALKAEITHALDILGSTRHAVRHHEVERSSREARPPPGSKGGGGSGGAASPPPAGTRGAIEVHAERTVREQTQERAGVLSSKATRLTGIAATQQLLIQRLEKQLLKEEGLLEQREARLTDMSRQRLHLKGALRRRSDAAVAAALGVPGDGAGGLRPRSVPPGLCPDGGAAERPAPAAQHQA